MSEISARLSLPYMMPSQAQKHVTHNEALERLDSLVQLAVEAMASETPPADPQAGQVWALGAAPTGDWADHAGDLAAWTGEAWLFIVPRTGWRAADKGDGALYVWTGSAWERPPLPDLTGLDGIGVNTGHDATNRLSVSAPATLLSHEGAGHRLKINKAAAGDTGSLLFQTGWSGRAEMGTAGTDDFSIKVSPDGSTWYTGLSFDAATGKASAPKGLDVTGDLEIDGAFIEGEAVTIANDAVATIAPGFAGGLAFITVDNDHSFPKTANGAVFYFDVGDTPILSAVAIGTNAALTTGALTGTTGADGLVTYSAHDDGKLYLENRTGGSRTFTVHIMR